MTPIEKKKSPAIEARNLTKSFKSLTAVGRVSFEVGKGEIFGIVGPDGAGKTTLLRMLATIMDPGSGGAAIAGFDTRTQASHAKANMAYMSQRFGLYPDLSVRENIHFYADLYGIPRTGREARLTELLRFSHLQAFEHRKARDLSGGMKQKLQLICALIHTPKVLLLDEPTNGVDPLSRRDFWRILYKIVKQGVAILVTTAYLDEAERCDRIGFLDQGRLLATGSPRDIRQQLQGKILTITSPDARQINTLLQTKLAGLNVALFGDTVHVVCRQVQATQATIIDLIQARGLRHDAIKQAQPSLEDVFVSMMSTPGHLEPKPPSPGLARGSGHRPGEKTDQKSGDPYGLRPGQRPGQMVVQADHLTRIFGQFTAVDDLSFQVPRGEIFGFLGPNGAGKSTTIRMLCGLLSPSSGKGLVAGYDIARQAEQVKQHIGYMSQKFSLYEDLTAEENIQFYGGIYGLAGPAMKTQKAWAIEMAGLAGHEKTLTGLLSAGWKQRLALACAILHEPPIIFLDEPTSGVDPISRRRFWDLIYDMADQGTTIFVTTHYMEEAEYCDRLALIYRGRMIAMGTPIELKTRNMHDQIIDLRCDNPQQLAEQLVDISGIKDVSLFGAGLHMVTIDADSTEKKIRRRLFDLGINAGKLETILPGMEDVFISLIEADDQQDMTARSRESQP